MKRALAMIFLAVLTVGLLGSCTKNIEERLDKTEADVAKIENAIGRYGDLQSDIAAVLDALKKDVGSRPASEQQSVWNCINALQNQRSTFDTAIKALQKLVGEEAVSAQIDAATAELISDYNLDNLASTLQELKDKVNAKYDITAIEKEVEKLKGRMDVISYAMAEMSEIEGMIQSVSIAPAYSDGSIKADEEGLLTFRCIVSPANALSGERDLEECFTLYANSVEVLTKGKKSKTIPILGIQLLDRTQGVYEITANISSRHPEEGHALTVALDVKTSTSDFITKFVKVTALMPPPEIAVKGEFTVNEAGKKVWFSQGNLYWNGNAFNFEANQYDFRHYYKTRDDAAVIGGTETDTPEGTVGSFFWSKSAEVAYAEAYDVNNDPDASTADVLFTNDPNDAGKPNSEFTVNGEKCKWRSLTVSEWEYLVSGRKVNGETGFGKTCVWAEVSTGVGSNKIKGLIIFHDDYTGEKTDLTTIPEGCAFLPAAGFRVFEQVFNIGTSGFYWSSTSVTNDPRNAMAFDFESTWANTCHDGRGGHSLRLVKDVTYRY